MSSATISVPPQLLLERILTLEIVRVTERAAVSAARLRGHGNEKAADQAAVNAMRDQLNMLDIKGVEGAADMPGKDELRAAFLAEGGQTFHYIPCLNDSHPWIAAMADIAIRHLQGWPTRAADPALLDAQRQRALAAGATQ